MTGKASEPAAGFRTDSGLSQGPADPSPGRLLMPRTTAHSGLVDGIIGGGTWEGAHARHEAAGIHGAARQRGGGVAVRGAGAASHQALSHRSALSDIANGERRKSQRLPATSTGARLRRRAKPRHRLSL